MGGRQTPVVRGDGSPPVLTPAAQPSAAQERWDLGPWENGYRQIRTPGGGFFRAEVVAHVFGGDIRRERVIVAAPEVLAALILAHPLLHTMAMATGSAEVSAVAHAATNALAKALGADPKAGA